LLAAPSALCQQVLLRLYSGSDKAVLSLY
jgi:hypothetical protein